MKTIFLFISIMVSILSFCQTPYQIADSSKMWNTISFGFGSFGIYYCNGTTTNKIEGQEIFNDSIYFNVLESQDSMQQNWNQNGYLIEDTTSKKVYYTASNQDMIGLIYDFDLMVGDSVIIDNYYASYENILLICDSIDSININGTLKKRLYLFSPGNPFFDIWIEGIGSRFGLFWSGLNGFDLTGGTYKLLCCSKNDTIMYMDTFFNSCYIEEFYPKIASEYYDTAYLNQNYQFQVQISDTNNIDSIELKGNLIPDGFSFNELTGIITGIPNDTGSFPCRISIKNCDLGFFTDVLNENIIVELVTSDHENLPNDIEIFPNPFDSYLLISFTYNRNEPYKIEIYNLVGKVIFEKITSNPINRISFGDNSDGIYILKITDSNNRIIAIEKIIKKYGA